MMAGLTDSTTSNNKPGRIPSLDGLRAISILLVIAAHFLHTVGISDLNVGALGVRVFFVISGFLISGLLISEIDKTSTIRLAKFYYRRTLRIFPPYYFFLGVMLLLLSRTELPICFDRSHRPLVTSATISTRCDGISVIRGRYP